MMIRLGQQKNDSSVNSSFATYTACPEEVTAALQHGKHINKLTLAERNEAAVLRIIVLKCSSNEDGI